MKQKIKARLVKLKKKFFSTRKMAMISTVVFLAVGTTIFFSANYFAKGATYGWLQEGWSGGADTGAVANHTDNREGWLKFFSKDDEVTVNGSGDLTLSGATSDWQETDDEDFNAGTKSDVYVANGDVKLKKPEGASCTASDECYENPCANNICGEWISGSCSGFDVYYIDRVGGATNWSTAMSYCDSFCPTCDLPTITELQCIYANRVSFGNNFGANEYRSATEIDGMFAYNVLFADGSITGRLKANTYFVRCIRR